MSWCPDFEFRGTQAPSTSEMEAKGTANGGEAQRPETADPAASPRRPRPLSGFGRPVTREELEDLVIAPP